MLYDIAAVGDLLSAATRERNSLEHLDAGTVLHAGAMIDRKAKQAIDLADRLFALTGRPETVIEAGVRLGSGGAP